MRDFINAAGGRRFLLAVGALIISSVMLWFGKVTGGEYVTLCLLTYGGFITGNVMQRKIEAGTNDQ
jgi:hypothetical protein